jgi:O-antigen/teichoic acid export membrane protein
MAALVAMLLLPMFSKMIAAKENLNSLVQFSTGLMLIPAFAFCLLAFGYQEPIIHLLNQHSNDYAAWVFGLVILCFFPLCIMYIYGTLLTANGNFNILNMLAALALILNVGLNLWLIPIYKAYGAAIAAICTQAFIGFSNLFFGIKILKIRFEPTFITRFFASLLLIGLLLFVTLTLKFTWWQASISIILGTIGSMFGLKILDFKQGIELLKSRQAEKGGL